MTRKWLVHGPYVDSRNPHTSKSGSERRYDESLKIPFLPLQSVVASVDVVEITLKGHRTVFLITQIRNKKLFLFKVNQFYWTIKV